MKKILILGAGIYQVPLIKTAIKRGLEVIVTSVDGNYPGFKLADKVYHVDTTHEEAILKIAHDENIDGICTSGTDVAMKSLGRVVNELGLSGPSHKAADASSNKLVMKKLFKENHVLTAPFKEVKSLQDCYDAFQELKPPLIFKVLDSSGSRGTVRVNSTEEIAGVFETISRQTSKDSFIVEEFIEGVEFGAQAFIRNGKLIFVLPHGDIMHKGNTSVPVGHYLPVELKLNNIDQLIENAAKGLGMDNCAINADLMWRDGEIYFLEIAARAGATCLPELVSIYYGIDYYDLIIGMAMGEMDDIPLKNTQPCGAEVIRAYKSGVLEGFRKNTQDVDYLIDLSMDYAIGNEVKEFKVGPDRIGQIIVKGNSPQAVINNLATVKSNLQLKIR